jgi:hypothetical protein
MKDSVQLPVGYIGMYAYCVKIHQCAVDYEHIGYIEAHFPSLIAANLPQQPLYLSTTADICIYEVHPLIIRGGSEVEVGAFGSRLLMDHACR